MTMDYGAILDKVFSGGAKQPKLIYVGRLAYLEQPNGARARSPENDLPPEENTAIVPGADRNPQIISGKVITRDEAGNIVAEQVPGLEPRITINNAPSQSATGLSLGQVQQLAPGVTPDQLGNLRIQGRVDYYKPIGQDRNGGVIYDYVAAPASPATANKPTVADAVGGALRGLGIGGSEQPAPSPRQAPAPVDLAAPTPTPDIQEFYRLPTPGEQIRGIERGPLDMVRLPTGPGGSRDINRDTVNMGLAASGLAPSGDFEKDFRTWGNEQGKRAILQAINPDMGPARIQSAFFEPATRERSSIRNERIANLLGELDLTRDPMENVGYTDEYRNERLDELGLQGFAEGGTVATGNWLSDAKAHVGDLFEDNRARQARALFGGLEDQGFTMTDMGENYTGQLYRHPGTNAMVPPWLLPAYSSRGGGYGGGLARALGRWANTNTPGQGFLTGIPREREENNSYTGNGINSFPNAGRTPGTFGAGTRGYTSTFAGGGSMMVDEPITAYGEYSGEPRFTMGEPNALTGGAPTREVMNVTPLEPSSPMDMPSQQAPVSRAPAPNDIAVLANVVHMMMGRRGKKAAYRPAPLGGY